MTHSTDNNDARTLFLDRDGVINKEPPQYYVHSWNEFHFYEKTIAALQRLSWVFPRIIVVTNQQGVGKGLMSQAALDDIHERMCVQLLENGVRIDAVYAATALAENDTAALRKPHIGMALLAQREFPAIRFEESTMVGDSLRDLQFARHLGMQSIWIQTTPPATPQPLADAVFESLWHYALSVNPYQ
ncbi:MAG: HAD-IIIA family hydrolase [Sphingobacteriales bacterium]|nr:HAD-IIIA family hydrolase [Sphingobacteriales bacterium]